MIQRDFLLGRGLNTELPWMSDCVTKSDVTNIGVQHDLKDMLKEMQKYFR